MTMSATTRGSTVVGVFDDREDARDAIEALKDDGFTADSISILSPDKQATQEIAEDTGTHAGAGAATGAVTGGILGSLGGWLVGIGALAIPGVGPFIAAGALATALGGAAIGAGVGAIAGALMGMGVPDEHASYYEGEAKAGKTLVTVRAGDRYDDAQSILRDHGADDVESRNSAAQTTGNPVLQTGSSARPTREAEGTLQLREEELVANKQRVETGEVRVGKDIVSEERTLEVPVTRDEVVIERHPVDRRPSDSPIGDRGQSIELPVREERVELEKRTVVYEEVGVGKHELKDTEHVSGTVRREEARVERDGDVNMASADAAGWEQAMPGYRQRWQERYGTSGNRWEDVEPGYQYGFDMRNQSQYRGRAWSDVEPEVRRDWNQHSPTMPWERAKESVREAWENTTER
jgi:uncharacterized protein (TIGR02271 family)